MERTVDVAKTSAKIKSKNKTEPTKSKLRENIEAVVIAVILALFIRAFVVQAFKIPSGSMKDTLLIGDHILVNKFIYGVKLPFTNYTLIPVKDPGRGDIVVFKYPKDPKVDYIKRVVGIAGDKVEIRNKKVFLNGVPQELAQAVFKEPANIFLPQRDNFGPVTVPANSLFVMGDNRDQSSDSRFWGFVSVPALKGKAFMIYWSWNKEDFGVRWRRIGNILK